MYDYHQVSDISAKVKQREIKVCQSVLSKNYEEINYLKV